MVFQLGYTQDKINSELDLKIMPLKMVDVYPRIRFGAEYRPHTKYAYSLDLGIGSKNTSILFTPGENYIFFEIRPEIKYYKKGNASKGRYFSSEFFSLYSYYKE